MLHRIDNAHYKIIWDMDWHPSGQMLATSGNDWHARFWGIQRSFEENFVQ
jgi:WD40 repeat protein